MKKVIVIAIVLTITAATSLTAGYYYNQAYNLKYQVEELELRISRANENAQGWANEFAGQTYGGANDEWFEKMQKHALDSLKIYLKWRMKLVSSTSEKQTLHM